MNHSQLLSGFWKTIRVFVSSTFRDMQSEREYLVKIVFPILRERLESYRIHLVDIDLRWGVTRAQAENNRVVELCLAEIDECRPYFIGLLGERYGWIPQCVPESVFERFPWTRDHKGKSLTEMEFLHGALNNSNRHEHALFFLRNHLSLKDIPYDIRKKVYQEEDAESKQRLSALKAAIRSSGYYVMDGYNARWEKSAYDRYSQRNGKLVGLEHFGNQVLEQLWRLIKKDQCLDEIRDPVPLIHSLDMEQEWHECFMESHRSIYVGRHQLRNDLLVYVCSQDSRPLLLTGASGSGKSAALSQLAFEIREKHPDVIVIAHFAGASSESTSLHNTLRRLCLVLAERSNVSKNISEEFWGLVQLFRFYTSVFPATQRVVILIDGIDKMDRGDQPLELAWVPERLPSNIKLLLSCFQEENVESVARTRAKEKGFIDYTLNPLSDEDRYAIIHAIPSLSARTLDEDQIDILFKNAATRNPLFLKVVLDELQGFGSFENLGQRVSDFPSTEMESFSESQLIRSLFGQVIARLEEDFHTDFTQRVLSLIASSRYGLTEKELVALTSSNENSDLLFPILRQLRPYLMKRGAMILFQHQELKEAVIGICSDSCESQRARHHELAEFFFQNQSDNHGMEEIFWQQCQAQDWKALFDLLSNPDNLSSVYRTNRYEILEYWHQLEEMSDFKICDAYERMLVMPEAYSYEQLTTIALLLEETGYLDEGLHLTRYLLKCYDKKPLADMNSVVTKIISAQASILFQKGQWDESIRLYKEEERIYRQLENEVAVGISLGNQGRILLARGELKRALELFRQQERISREWNDLPSLQTCLGNQAIALYRAGNKGYALNLFMAQERLCRKTGDLNGLQSCLGNHAVVLMECGDSRNALKMLQEKESICRKLGNRIELSAALGNQGIVHISDGNYETALKYIQEQETLCREAGNLPGLSNSLGNLGVIQRNMGQYEKAKRSFEQQVALCRETGDNFGLANALLNLAILLAIEFDAAPGARKLTIEAIALYGKIRSGNLAHAKKILKAISDYERSGSNPRTIRRLDRLGD